MLSTGDLQSRWATPTFSMRFVVALSTSTLFASRLSREVRVKSQRSVLSELAIGAAAALLATAARYVLPLAPDQLPTVTVVITLALVTTFVGLWAGVSTAVVGGLACWYLFFTPFTWTLGHGVWLTLAGFAVIAAVIITTAHLYRVSERRQHASEIADLRAKANNAEHFAREMAHRQKNALAIAQAIAFQTIGIERDEASKFASRLKALAEANELLNEDIEKPWARVPEVVDAALAPFSTEREKIQVDAVDAAVPAQQVVSLALALHELATNASKHGALSADSGRVTIKIEDLGDRLSMTWAESGGPEVCPPSATGFGTKLLRRSGMQTELHFAREGVRCSMGLRKI